MPAPVYCECGRRIVIMHVGKDGGTRALADHDKCRQCWRSMRDSTMAATARPRVDRAVRVSEKKQRAAYLERRERGTT
jgi:hypothetical protein